MCENKSRTTCSRFHRLHSESNLACGSGLWGSTRSLRAAHSPSPHAVKRKKHSLTLLLQNHLDHLNILLLGVVGTSTRAVARAFASEPQPLQKTLVKSCLTTRRSKIIDHFHNLLLGSVASAEPLITSTICSRVCGTGTSTICCTVRFDIHSSGITLITSTICSWICGTGTAMTVRCTRRTCDCDGDDQVHHAHLSNIATQIASCGDKEGNEMDNKKHKRWNPWKLWANSSDCSTRWQKQDMGTFSHTPHAKEKTLRETWRPRHEIEQHTRTCTVRLLAAPQPSTGRCNDCLFTKGVKKNQEIKHNHCDCLARLQSEPLLDLLFLTCSSGSSICRAMRPDDTRVPQREDHGTRLSCEIHHVYKASLSWPSSSCAPDTLTTGCRNSSGASSTSSSRRSR